MNRKSYAFYQTVSLMITFTDPIHSKTTKICKLCIVLPRLRTHEAWQFKIGLHRVSKNVPPSTCYNLDIHDPITIIFGRSVTEKARNQTMLCFPTSHIYCFCITLQNRKPRRQCTGALCLQQSPTAAVLSTSSFLLNHATNSPNS